MNPFKFISVVLAKSAIAIEKSLDFVVVTAETCTETMEIAQLAVRTVKAEQQNELDSVLALVVPPPVTP